MWVSPTILSASLKKIVEYAFCPLIRIFAFQACTILLFQRQTNVDDPLHEIYSCQAVQISSGSNQKLQQFCWCHSRKSFCTPHIIHAVVMMQMMLDKKFPVVADPLCMATSMTSFASCAWRIKRKIFITVPRLKMHEEWGPAHKGRKESKASTFALHI